ncbi:MAG: polyphosphate:AMP phosphotransferase, partial [Candidatus Latescibacteria bacterium]|nr:polyphosphate:AMP phosphotransferase [Candidatus Latescibacterota bacterium]
HAAGRGDAIMTLVNPMDPRGFRVRQMSPPGKDEQSYPFLWRYWKELPPAGWIGMFDGSWYNRVLRERIEGTIEPRQWQNAYQEISQFERQLVDDDMVVIKLFMHISKKELKRRLKWLEKNPAESWRVTPETWKNYKNYDDHLRVADEMLERTNTSDAPWTVVEATQRRYRRVKIIQTVSKAIEDGLELKRRRQEQRELHDTRFTEVDPATTTATALKDIPTILDRADLSVRLRKKEYNEELIGLQERLRDLEFECFKRRVPVVIAYEGWDAAGKGGNIKRVTELLDPRGYEVIPIAAPSSEERVHHYLWRFWRRIPKAGHIGIFDRTWYGRVLVEWLEGFIDRETYQRSFQEITEFEQSLVNFGTVVVKFWIHIDKDEQFARFESRQQIPEKQHKITDEDWRNREKWDAYAEVITEMIERTSTSYAPWTIVEGNNKRWARVKATKTIITAIENTLDRTDA